MKKYILVLGIMLSLVSMGVAEAKYVKSSELTNAIRLYKVKNYTQSYEQLKDVVKSDPSNALAYYYLAMASAQIGKKAEAIDSYTKVINLSPNGQLGRYANKGKRCLLDESSCNEIKYISDTEKFIKSPYGSGFTDAVRSDYEKHKIENLMREMNRKNDLSPKKFEGYRDFSSEVPTNDEIVNAIYVLKRAGLFDLNANNLSNVSMLGYGQNQQALQSLLMNGNNSASMNPQVIQSLLTNQMSVGF